MKQRAYGFTIVELLIVIVVIAILAAISVAAYTNISNRANDSAIKSDLSSIAKVIQMYKVEKGELPITNVTLMGSLGLQATKGSYSEGYTGGHNLLYCRSYPESTGFALVAWSKSGSGFAYVDGSVRDFDYDPAVMATTCPRAGISSAAMLWLYNAGVWRI